jgi:protein-tyrosine phosphatase
MKQDIHMPTKSILFVCLGNICRSPIAEGLFRHIARQAGTTDRFIVDSAGLGSWHVGHQADERAQTALAARGIDISDLRARQVSAEDFERFDLILAMDRSNRQGLLKIAPKDKQHKVRLFMEYAPRLGVREIPDPYFGGREGFDYVCQLVDAACRGLMHSQLPRPSYATPTSRPLAPAKG